MNARRLVTRLTEDRDHGCLMVNLSAGDGFPIREWAEEHIDQESLVQDGYEATPHITVLYGFDPSVKAAEVLEACDEFTPNVDIELTEVSRFSSEKYDVIKVDVKSTDLEDMNKLLMQQFGDRVESTHPKYHPHLTLAYVKKGAHPELNGHQHFVGSLYRINQLVYSSPDEEKAFFSLGKKQQSQDR